MNTVGISGKFALALALVTGITVSASPASALMRTYVSSRGSNAAGCGTVASPCQTLQYGHNAVTNAGGEIVILDSGLYGPVTITKAISIVNDGTGTATVYAGANGNAITINTANATDVVHLRGLEIDGLGVAANGVVFKGRGTLDVVHCVIRRFSGSNADGVGHGVVVIQGGSSPVFFSIADTISSDNMGVGMYFLLNSSGGDVEGVISRTVAARNAYGIDLNNFGSGFPNHFSVNVVDSLMEKNGTGLYVLSPSTVGVTRLDMRNTTVSDSANEGVHIEQTATVVLSQNKFRQFSGTLFRCVNGGSVFSYGDNYLDGGFGSCSVGPISKR